MMNIRKELGMIFYDIPFTKEYTIYKFENDIYRVKKTFGKLLQECMKESTIYNQIDYRETCHRFMNEINSNNEWAEKLDKARKESDKEREDEKK